MFSKHFKIPPFYASVMKMSSVRAMIIILSFAGSVLLTRNIGPEGRGLVAWFVSASTVAMMFAQCGIEVVNRRFVAEDPKIAGGMVPLTLKICLAGTLMVLPFFVFAVLNNHVGRDHWYVLFISIFAIYFMAAAPCLNGIQLGLNNVKGYMWSNAMQKLSNLLLVVVLVVLKVITPVTALLALLISYMVQVGMSLYNLRGLKREKGSHKASLAFVWSKKHYMLYTHLRGILATMVSATIPLVLGLQHSLTSAGIFAACMIIVDAINKTFGMISTYAVPQLVGAKTKADRNRLKKSIKRVSFWGMTLIAAVFIANAYWFIPLLLGEEFRPAVPVFQVLCLHMIFTAMNETNQAIIMAHSERVVILVSPIAMLATVSLLAWTLIPLYGAMGGTVALVVSSAVGVFVSWLCARKVSPHETTVRRVVISTYTFLPDIGGVATCNYALAGAMQKAGYDVTVVTNTPGPEMKEGYKILRRVSPLKLLWIYGKADAVLLSNLSVKLGWPVLLMPWARFGLFHHSSTAFEPPAPGLGGLVKRIVAGAIVRRAVHFPNSEFTRKDGRKVLAGKKCAVVYPIALKTEVALESLKAYRARKDVFFAGRLVADKGVDYLIGKWPEIQKTLGVEKLFIAGDGPARDQLKAEVAKLGLSGISFMGKQPLEVVVKGMREAAYVMIPSVWEEPFGIVGVEGVASGAVVISSNRGGLPEAVGDVGVLFGFDEPKDFSAALKKAKALREKIVSSEAEFEAYRELANRHLGQFSAEAIVGIIRKNLG